MDAGNREQTEGTAPSPTLCYGCGIEIGAADKFCRHCGRRQGSRVAAWYHRPAWILFLAFTVLGPFALPLVCRSPLLSRRMKWVLATVILLVTVVAAYGSWQAGLAMIKAWKALVDELGGAGAF